MIIGDFKTLVEDNKAMLNELTLGLFEDSIRCFDAGIYRQAYMLAYQGFTQYIRSVARNAKKPVGYNQSNWNKVQANLINEKEFDDQVFTCIQQKNCHTGTPPVVAILDMPDTLRSEAKIKLLIKYGLLDCMKSSKLNPEFTRRNARECGKNHYDFFRGIAYTLPMDKFVVEMMFAIFNETEYPTVWCSIYKEMIDNDQERNQQFQKIIANNGLLVPFCLK